MELKIEKEWFVDTYGRKVLLRGVNLAASSKVPYKPNGATHIPTDFSDHRDVSYVGRPFPLNEADEHFSRLKHWGFNTIRFLVSWEGIEHKGPQQYDKEYLDYLEEILKIATEKYGFYVFLDPHQDVWSRMTGGDGAPGWTFEKVGLDFTKFVKAKCAWLMQNEYNPNDPEAYPPMFWPQNQLRLPVATMFTLFFGGDDFAPLCKVDGIGVKQYLRDHMFNAIKQVVKRVKHLEKVIGLNTPNEPPSGWIGIKVDGSNYNYKETLGHSFTPIDAMAVAAGIPRSVGYRVIKKFGIKEIRKDIMNADKISIWLPGYEDIWRREGVWDIDPQGNPVILKNDHFIYAKGKEVNFFNDYLCPFIIDFGKSMRNEMPDAMIFFEGPSEDMLKGKVSFNFPDGFTNIVNEAHWYDVATLGTKKPMLKASMNLMTDRPVLGKGNILQMFSEQLGVIKKIGLSIHQGVPTLIGEFGIPIDLEDGKAFKILKDDPSKAWESHIECLDAYYNAMDDNLLNCTQWNYTPDNTNKWGDGWNLEDISIFSRDQQTNPEDINSGARALLGFCRPHYVTCAGTPKMMKFNYEKGIFEFEYNADSKINEPTIIYVPKIQFPNGYQIKTDELEILENKELQLLMLKSKTDGLKKIEIIKI